MPRILFNRINIRVSGKLVGNNSDMCVFFVLQLLRQIPIPNPRDAVGDAGDTEMPFTEVGVELEVHIELVPSGIVEVAPLQTDEGSLKTRGGSGYDWGADSIRFGRCHFYSRGKHMGRKGTVE